jgi:hypothetical protein
VAEVTACQVDGAQDAAAPVGARRHDLLASSWGDPVWWQIGNVEDGRIVAGEHQCVSRQLFSALAPVSVMG